MTALQPLVDSLDVSTLPRSLTYEGEYGSFELADLLPKIQHSIEFFASEGIVREEDSFGFAVVIDGVQWEDIDPDDPSTYISFVGGWGPRQDQCIANAVRKIRFALKIEDDSINVAQMPDDYEIDVSVPSATPEGTFPWGSFPHGGAVFLPFGKYENIVSSSALAADEDDLSSGFVGKLIGLNQHRVNMKPKES
jgi:hypothetical protein